MKPIITLDMFVQGWRKIKERNSDGISILHFGHIKTVTFRKYITQIEYSLCYIPFR